MTITKDYQVVILSHFYKRAMHGGGPPQEIRDFIVPKVKSLIYIEHPFPYADDHRSSMTIYEEGKLKEILFTLPIFGPQTFFYILNIFTTVYFLIRARRKFDLCIALDSLNTLSTLPFRKLDLINKLVFYTIDYTPVRFKNKLLNYFYHLSDKIACYNADTIWIVSKKMIEARKSNGVNLQKSASSVLLPMGAKLDRITILPINQIKRYQIVFVGHLLEKQGVQLVLKSLVGIIKKIPKVKFVIIGQGEYEGQLRKLSKRLELNNFVEFKGFVKSHLEVEKILCESAIGIASYKPSIENYTFYADPGKPKLYLGCGLPMVITKVPSIAIIIDEKKAGFVAEYSVKSITNALITLLSDDALYRQYRKNALRLSREYNTDHLIKEALKQS